MHDLSNESPWQVSLAAGFSHKREPLAMVVIKAAYAIDIETGALTLLQKKPVIEMADQHEGEPLKSGLTVAGECSPPKVGGEFYILGATLTLPLPSWRPLPWVIATLASAAGVSALGRVRVAPRM